MCVRVCLIWLVVAFFSVDALGGVIDLEKTEKAIGDYGEKYINLNPHLEYFPGSSDVPEPTKDNVLQYASSFKHLKKGEGQEKIHSSTWLRFTLFNSSNSAQKVKIKAMTLWSNANYTVYIEDRGRIIEQPTAHHRYLSFHVMLNEPSTLIYIKTANRDFVRTKYQILSDQDYLSSALREYFIYALPVGVSIMALAINIFLWLTTKSKDNKRYVFYLLVVIVWASYPVHIHGIAYLDNINMSLSGLLVLIGLYFVSSFLQLKERFHLNYRLFIVLSGISLILILLYCTEVPAMFNFSVMMVAYLLFPLVIIFSACVTLWVYRQGHSEALWIFIGFASYIMCMTYALIIQNGPLANFSPAIEHVILAFALANLINRKKENLSKERNRHHLTEADLRILKSDLEQRVKKRASELTKANDSLNSTIRSLKSTQSDLIEVQKNGRTWKIG